MRRFARSSRIGLGACAVSAALAALMLAEASAAPPAQAASCSGQIQASSFSFSCDTEAGGNPEGLLFAINVPNIESASVASPAGIGCEAWPGQMQCKGSPIPAGTTVSGSFTLGPSEEEAGEGGGCEGASIVVYGSETFIEPETEESGPKPIGSLGTPCGSSGEGATTRSPFALGRVKLDRRRGTALLPVSVPAPGSLAMTGRGVARVSVPVKRAGKVQLTVRASGKAKHKLLRTRRVTVKVEVTFTPNRGRPVTKTTDITLRLA